MARLLYEEWFVKFRFPGYEQGMIPEGWEAVRFSTAADFINGFAFEPKHWSTVGKPIIKIAELKNGVTDRTPYYEGADIGSKYHVQNGDLLFSWSADLDVYIWNQGEALLNQHLFKVVPHKDFSSLFLFFTLKEHMQEFRSKSQGTTMRHIKRAALDEVRFLLPPYEIRKIFEDHAEPMLLAIRNLSQRNSILRRTCDLLLPKLISGEIDVSSWTAGDAEEVAQELAASFAGRRTLQEQIRRAGWLRRDPSSRSIAARWSGIRCGSE